ncbi:putative membrane protein [Flavobacterium sp. W4I14]|nr:putative membrane protein [Flavobacterium sp. W4I14]
MLSTLPFNRLRLSGRFALFFIIFFAPSVAAIAQQLNEAKAGPSAFTAKLINIEAATNEVFRYSTTLHNGTNKQAIYELKAALPEGWVVSYKVEGSQVTSLNMDAGKSQEIAVEINASANASPKKYSIPLKAIAANDTLLLKLEAVVKGSYGVAMSTPSGRLSEEVSSGGHKDLQLEVKNTGTLPLNDLDLNSQLPSGWEVRFEPAKISKLEAGKSVAVTAFLKVPDKTIAGDYAATFSLSGANANTQLAFRMFVKTSLLSGWIGILVIVLAIGSVYYLIRRYGRR